MSDTVQSALYPRYCFHLAPTANAWCFLRTSDLVGLEQRDGFEGEGLFFYRNLPIKWVRIVGIVVAIDEFFGLRAYTIDDSSGACIEVIISLSPASGAPNSNKSSDAQVGPLAQPVTPYDHIDVGAVVDVKGALSRFRDARQIKVEKMNTVPSTSAETKLWVKRTSFLGDVLRQPWVLDDKTIRKCRREAERSEAETERKKKRVKDAVANGSSKTRKSTHQTGSGKDREKNKRRSRSAAERDDVIHILASSKGQYSALGL